MGHDFSELKISLVLTDNMRTPQKSLSPGLAIRLITSDGVSVELIAHAGCCMEVPGNHIRDVIKSKLFTHVSFESLRVYRDIWSTETDGDCDPHEGPAATCNG